MPVARLSSVRLLFDRGTTLLRDLDPGLDPSAIPGVLWDPRVQAYRTPAYRYRALRRELTRRAVPFSDEVRGPAAAVGLLVPDRAAAVPRGGAVGLGAGAAPSSRRPADRERQNPAGPRSD